MNAKNKPWLLVISGPNGAGKSTFFEYVISNNPFLSGAVFVNYDNEIKRLKSIPEYSARYEQIAQDTEYNIGIIQKNAAAAFKKQMEQIGGPLNERINQPIENKEYWHAQYRLFTRIPVEWEHIKPNIHSKKDLVQQIGGQTIHERINAKAENNNWYPTYKKLIHNPEIQKIIVIKDAEQRVQTLDNLLRKESLKNLHTRINSSFEQKQNIIFETTGAGIERINKQAKKNNYNIFGSHICVLHPEISVSRVQQRVQKGGHDVPINIIFQRYQEYLTLLPRILPTEDIAIVIDNSGKKPFMPVFAMTNGHLINISQCPEYLRDIHEKITAMFPQKTIQNLLHTTKSINIKTLTDEQHENFGQIVITTLFGLANTPPPQKTTYFTFLHKIGKTFYSYFQKNNQK